MDGFAAHRLRQLIVAKRDGGEHSAEEIALLVRAVTVGAMPDYQVAAWLMAVFLRGLSDAETLALTLAMRDSGEVISWAPTPPGLLDKHSSGGVGDKTTLVVVPILAALGVPMLKMSGRGLGFAGGTIDKLEAIPGLVTDLPINQAKRQVQEIGAAIIGQTPSLVPADKRLYALRDVTGTVESLPLIAASIMSKKLAGGAGALLLDVKVGRGAYLKTEPEARQLAAAMVAVGGGAGVKTVAVLTDMEEPLGYSIGNALEVAEACATLTGSGRVDGRFRALCLAVAVRGLMMLGESFGESEALVRAEATLRSGSAADKFADIIEAQGGDRRVVRETDRLPRASCRVRVDAMIDGYVQAIDAEALGVISVRMGAGRARKHDAIDPGAGIILYKKTGDCVRAGEPVAELHLNDTRLARDYAEALLETYTVGAERPTLRAIVMGTVD